MRTMKKILALSLVLAMAFSLMAGAAFKDQDKINEDLVADINLLIALNVYNEKGTGEGYFEPNGIVTREQAAKLLYVMKNKGVDNGAISWTGIGTFTDVEAGRWSEGYIEYCAATGMIVGDGTGKFNPTQPITGNALAKLMLVMIGYKADVQGYTGINWEANVMRDAETAGFYVEYDLPVRGQVTREWASKILVNGINATKVKYVDGQREEQYDLNKKPVTFANTDLGMNEFTGIAMSTSKVGLAANPAKGTDNKTSVVYGSVDGVVANNKNLDITFDIPESLLGEQVKVLYKGTKNDYKEGDKIYGVVATGKSKVYNTIAADVTVKTDVNTIKLPGFKDGTATALENQHVTVYVDYVPTKTNNPTAAEAATLFSNNIAKQSNQSVKFVDQDGNGTLDVAFIKTEVYGKVERFDAAKYQLKVVAADDTALTNAVNVSAKTDFEKYQVSSVEKGDIVKLTTDYSTGKKLTVVTKLDSVNGKIEKVTADSITLNGTTFKASANAMKAYNFASSTAQTSNLNKELYVYTDGKYVVYEGSKSSTNFPSSLAMLIGHEAGTGLEGKDRVKIIDKDGKVAIYNYSKSSSTAGLTFADVKNYAADDLKDPAKTNPVFEVVQNGDAIYFKALATNGSNYTVDDTKTLTYTKKTSLITGGNVTALANDNTVFFVKYVKDSKDAYAVLKKNEIVGDKAESTAAGTIGYTTTNGVNTAAVAAMVMGSLPTTSTASDYVMVLAKPYATSENDKVVYKVDVVNSKNEKSTITVDSAKAANMSVNEIFKVNGISDGVTDVVAPSSLNNAAITGFGDNFVVVENAGPKYYRMNSDTKIVFIDTKLSTTAKYLTPDMGSFANGTNQTTGDADSTVKNALYVLGTNSDELDLIKTIFVEVNGASLATDYIGDLTK